VSALSPSEGTGAVLVDREKCIGCGECIDACPGKIPHIHPAENYALICDLCGGDPECVKVCREGGWDVLKIVQRDDESCHLYARTPEEITRDLVVNLYGEIGEELI
jgi:Fe-S-cluster-containing dehydrogenase component